MRYSPAETIRFALLVSVVASVLVAGSAVLLADRQEANRLLHRRARVLEVLGLRAPGERLARAEIERRFASSVRPVAVELASGATVTDFEVAAWDPRRAARDPATSRPAPPNAAGVRRLPDHVLVYHLVRNGEIGAVVLPVEGQGLWSTMYGYLALDADLRTVLGITFYEHAETPGLGAEIDAPRWRALWEGRSVFGPDGEPRIEVVKGPAGPPAVAPFQVDGLAGATLTGRGVTNTLRFWLGPDGFGPYLRRYRETRGRP